MPTITDKLAAALRNVVSYCTASVPESPCHADLDTIGDIAAKALAEYDATPAVAPITLSDAETATVLAALRYWQRDMEQALNDDREDWTVTLRGDGHFQEHAPLSVEEIDALCERLNEGQ